MSSKKLTKTQSEALLTVLHARFEKHSKRHKTIKWAAVEARLRAHGEKLWSLSEMERTEGEPDVVGFDKKSGAYVFMDCAPESPKGRRGACYDREGQKLREKDGLHPGSAMDMAKLMGIEMLSEEEYRTLQALEAFDQKTSSWVRTPEAIRKKGGALFCDRRYDHVFLYHNGAESFYSARGFRGVLHV